MVFLTFEERNDGNEATVIRIALPLGKNGTVLRVGLAVFRIGLQKHNLGKISVEIR